MTENPGSPAGRVLLFNMPWGAVTEPSIGPGILKSVLLAHGIGCDVIEAPMRMLRYLKYETYKRVAQDWASADFVFTREFEEEVSSEQLQVLTKVVQDDHDSVGMYYRQLVSPDEDADRLLRLRREIVPRFLDDILAEIDFSVYSLVGFSCLFDQTISSLALARRIRRSYPNLMLAFGGYALHPPVGPALQRCFEEMDVIAYGDGEPVIVPLWEAASGLRALSDVPNISYRDEQGRIVTSSRSAKIGMDDSPAPNYDDFFRQREQLRDQHGVKTTVGEIPVESSRGCWYGQKAHCTFCGIDDETLKYRVKSARLTGQQLDQLYRRYNTRVFRFADYIMPLQYLHDFLPEMAKRGAPYHLHFETKANLKPEQIELCAKAGIRWFQPGIESFSSAVLNLMLKGVSAAQNVFALYTMNAHGIFPLYNLLFGFPFETAADYEPMLKLIPSLYHLPPPQTNLQVLITRHAPLGEQPERFGVKGPLKAHWRYDLIFSNQFRQEHGLSLDQFCYYYENPYRRPSPELKVLHDALQHQVFKWWECFSTRGARLTFALDGDGLVIQDTRFKANGEHCRFGAVHRHIGEILRAHYCTPTRLVQRLSESGIPSSQAESALRELIEARVVIEVDKSCVWIAFDEALAAETYGEYSNPEVRESTEWPEWERHQLVSIGAAG